LARNGPTGTLARSRYGKQHRRDPLKLSLQLKFPMFPDVAPGNIGR
jgi:hypothetical protein